MALRKESRFSDFGFRQCGPSRDSMRAIVAYLLFRAGDGIFKCHHSFTGPFLLSEHHRRNHPRRVCNVAHRLPYPVHFFRVSVYKFVGVVLAFLAVGSFFRQANWPAASFYLNTVVLEFFYGMVIAKICLASKHIPRYYAIPLLGLGFLGLLAPWSLQIQLDGVLHGVAAALIVYSMASLEDWLTRIPRFVLYMADASYAIYLFHPFIAPAVPAVLMKLHLVYPWLSVACSVPLALAGGCLVHLLIEAPITKWFRDHLLIGGKTSFARSLPCDRWLSEEASIGEYHLYAASCFAGRPICRLGLGFAERNLTPSVSAARRAPLNGLRLFAISAAISARLLEPPLRGS